MESTDSLVVASHRTFALQDVDFNWWLIVCRSWEYLWLASRDSCISVDEFCEYATQSFDTQRERSNVEQQYVLNFTCEHTTLNCSTDSYNFVRVHVLRWSLAEELLNNLLDCRDTSRTTHEDYFVDLRRSEVCILQSFATRLDCSLNQVVSQLFEFSTSQSHHQVLRNTINRHNVRQVDFGWSWAWQLDFSLFSSLFQTLQRHRVFSQVDIVFSDEVFSQPIDDDLVEVVATQVSVTVCRFYFKYAITEFEDRDIECTATQVINCDFHLFVSLVQTVCQSCSSRFVDDTFNGQTCDFASLFCSLTLRVREVCRNGDNCFVNLCAEVIFSSLFHLLQNHCRNLLRSVFSLVDFYSRSAVFASYYFIRYATHFTWNLVERFAHKALDRVDCTLRIGDSLTFCRFANFAFAIFSECYNRRSSSVSFAVRDNNCFVTLHYGNTRVGGAQVNTDNFCHRFVIF